MKNLQCIIQTTTLFKHICSFVFYEGRVIIESLDNHQSLFNSTTLGTMNIVSKLFHHQTKSLGVFFVPAIRKFNRLENARKYIPNFHAVIILKSEVPCEDCAESFHMTYQLHMQEVRYIKFGTMTQFDILKLIVPHHLKVLIVKNIAFSEFMILLKRFTQLEMVECGRLIVTQIHNFKNLKILKIHHTTMMSNIKINNMPNLIELKISCASLDIEDCPLIQTLNAFTYQLIFNDMVSHLKFVVIQPWCTIIRQQFIPWELVCSFKLNCQWHFERYLKLTVCQLTTTDLDNVEFLSLVQHVEFINQPTKELIDFISKNCPNIKHLKISSSACSIFYLSQRFPLLVEKKSKVGMHAFSVE